MNIFYRISLIIIAVLIIVLTISNVFFNFKINNYNAILDGLFGLLLLLFLILNKKNAKKHS